MKPQKSLLLFADQKFFVVTHPYISHGGSLEGVVLESNQEHIWDSHVLGRLSTFSHWRGEQFMVVKYLKIPTDRVFLGCWNVFWFPPHAFHIFLDSER